MSQHDRLETLMTRLATDEAFRRSFRCDPEGLLAAEAIEPHLVAALRQIDVDAMEAGAMRRLRRTGGVPATRGGQRE